MYTLQVARSVANYCSSYCTAANTVAVTLAWYQPVVSWKSLCKGLLLQSVVLVRTVLYDLVLEHVST